MWVYEFYYKRSLNIDQSPRLEYLLLIEVMEESIVLEVIL